MKFLPQVRYIFKWRSQLAIICYESLRKREERGKERTKKRKIKRERGREREGKRELEEEKGRERERGREREGERGRGRGREGSLTPFTALERFCSSRGLLPSICNCK